MPKTDCVAHVPGVGTVEDASGFVDVRHLGDRADLRRTIEVAMMSSPPLVVLMTDEQRVSLGTLSGQPVHVAYGDDTTENKYSTAVTEGKVDKDGREYVTVTGHPEWDRVVLATVDKASGTEVKLIEAAVPVDPVEGEGKV